MNTPACLLDPNDGLLYADVMFKATVQSTSAETYDVGLWIALTGGSAQTDTTNTCYRRHSDADRERRVHSTPMGGPSAI